MGKAEEEAEQKRIEEMGRKATEKLMWAKAPRCCKPASAVAAPALPCALPPPYRLTKVMKKCRENFIKYLPGDVYGLPLPKTPEELFDEEKMGTDWLNKAFHKAGSVPKDNKITQIVK